MMHNDLMNLSSFVFHGNWHQSDVINLAVGCESISFHYYEACSGCSCPNGLWGSRAESDDANHNQLVGYLWNCHTGPGLNFTCRWQMTFDWELKHFSTISVYNVKSKLPAFLWADEFNNKEVTGEGTAYSVALIRLTMVQYWRNTSVEVNIQLWMYVDASECWIRMPNQCCSHIYEKDLPFWYCTCHTLNDTQSLGKGKRYVIVRHAGYYQGVKSNLWTNLGCWSAFGGVGWRRYENGK